MGSKQKQTRIGQKAYIERRLEDRLALLSKKGIESPAIEKDALIKKLRADVRAINIRLNAIAANEKRTEGLAKMKAEKAAAAAAAPVKGPEVGKGKEKKEAPPAEVKEKKKKKVKEPKEAEASQEKVEK